MTSVRVVRSWTTSPRRYRGIARRSLPARPCRAHPRGLPAAAQPRARSAEQRPGRRPPSGGRRRCVATSSTQRSERVGRELERAGRCPGPSTPPTTPATEAPDGERADDGRGEEVGRERDERDGAEDREQHRAATPSWAAAVTPSASREQPRARGCRAAIAAREHDDAGRGAAREQEADRVQRGTGRRRGAPIAASARIAAAGTGRPRNVAAIATRGHRATPAAPTAPSGSSCRTAPAPSSPPSEPVAEPQPARAAARRSRARTRRWRRSPRGGG